MKYPVARPRGIFMLKYKDRVTSVRITDFSDTDSAVANVTTSE